MKSKRSREQKSQADFEEVLESILSGHPTLTITANGKDYEINLLDVFTKEVLRRMLIDLATQRETERINEL